ncbi:MAG: ferrous iron transport protein A [Chloroflexales bacterium]|nr:ferrous iron transport protein A [Chloroflexales bacterium]
MTTARVPLSEITVGQSGVIVALGVTGPLRRRLLALGIITGEIVTITRVAPLGDPLELEVKGYRLSLRKAEASQIFIAPQP